MSYIVTKFVLHANTSSSTIAAISTSSLSAAATSSATAPSAVAVATVSESMRREAMDVVVAKIICLLILTILSVLCGLLPLRLLIHTPHLFTRGRNSVDYFLCGLRLFSGGIYLATCFLHLMPDTRVKMDSVMKNMGSNTTYAVPELLVMSGFYAVVFVEQIIK
ncbi:zinc transporter ZIP3, partial [Biomphalaria glabrata]